MRLIDADELPEVNIIERIDGEREVFVNSWIPTAAIWKAPVVDAIPIEWIEKWIETDRNTKRRTPYYYKRLFRSRLKMMLEDWREKNDDE